VHFTHAPCDKGYCWEKEAQDEVAPKEFIDFAEHLVPSDQPAESDVLSELCLPGGNSRFDRPGAGMPTPPSSDEAVTTGRDMGSIAVRIFDAICSAL
jgi:hypothetical protein